MKLKSNVLLGAFKYVLFYVPLRVYDTLFKAVEACKELIEKGNYGNIENYFHCKIGCSEIGGGRNG
jgi:hypothetical protein